MKRRLSGVDAALTTVVLLHFAISAVHGFAHTRANVVLPPAAMVFVIAVILVGPIAGLVLRHARLPQAGAWIIAATLAGSFLFGLANHFLLDGGDHVTHVALPYRTLFGVTAAMLAGTEALGVWLAVRAAVAEWHSRRTFPPGTRLRGLSE